MYVRVCRTSNQALMQSKQKVSCLKARDRVRWCACACARVCACSGVDVRADLQFAGLARSCDGGDVINEDARV